MRKRWLLLFVLAFSVLAGEKTTLPEINVWSGRVQEIPYEATSGWRVETDHGRFLAGEQHEGQVRVAFPVLDGLETAVLFVDGEKKARLVIHPEKLLAGLAADCRCCRAELEGLGARNVSPDDVENEGGAVIKARTEPVCVVLPHFPEEEEFAAKIAVVFTEAREFPLKLGGEWTDISLGMAKNKGGFSVFLNDTERIIDNRHGTVAWLTAVRDDGRKVILLPPEFDFAEIDNILFLKKELVK